MSFYSIEVNYPFNGLSNNQIEDIVDQIKQEINSIAKSTHGKFSAYDTDIIMSQSGPKLGGINYNWEFKNVEDLTNFLSKLPSSYKILWVLKYNNDQIDYTVFNYNKTPDVKRFNQDDNDLYRKIINRIKA